MVNMTEVLKDINELLDSKLSSSHMAGLMETLNGFSLDTEFCDSLVTDYPLIIHKILQYLDDRNQPQNMLAFLINISSQTGLILKLQKSDSNECVKFSESVGKIIDLLLKSSDINSRSLAAQLLSNITRENSDFFEMWKDSSKYEDVDNLFRIGLLFSNNKEDELLRQEAIMIILNFSLQNSCQKFIMENLQYFNDVLTIYDHFPSEKWKLAVIGLLKNLLKNSVNHCDLLEKTDLLTILLYPLIGLHKYEKKIRDEFPEKLNKYVDTERDCSPGLRCTSLEALYLLSATKYGRTIMRDSNVYDILKNISELDLTDEESDNCLDCIGLLIRTEDEIGYDDLLKLKIPKDVEEKFNN